MPQVRKRKTKEKVSDEVEKKRRKEISTVSAISSKRKPKREGPNSFEIKSLRSGTNTQSKRKIVKGSEISEQNTKKTPKEQNSWSPRKDPKIGKAKVVLYSLKVKDEPNEQDQQHSFNSSDSGIQSEILDSIKEETKPDLFLKAETPSTSFKTAGTNSNDDSSSSESEWEEVEDQNVNCLDDYKPDIPKEGVEITIDCPDLQIRKRKKKKFDENEWIRMHINRVRKDVQLSIHKTHLLCLLAHGIYVNEILNSDTLRALAISMVPNDILSFTSGKKVDKVDIRGVEKIITWFRDEFTFETEKGLFLNLRSSLEKSFECRKCLNASEYNLMFIIIARTLGFKVRFCVSLYPISFKATNLIKKPNSNKSKMEKSTELIEGKGECSSSIGNLQKRKIIKKKMPKAAKVKNEHSNVDSKKELPKISRPRRSKGKSYKQSSDEEDDNDDEDFIMHDNKSSDEDDSKPLKVDSKQKYKHPERKSNRKVLSSDSEPSSPKANTFEPESIICWAEVFSKPDKQWISVECVHNIKNKPYDIEVLAPQPVSYILSFDNESFVKDVTRRYCNEYMTTTIKLRVNPEWWEDTLDPFLPPNSKQDKEEEKKLDEMLVNKPLPHTVQGFKNHPLYALKRHLLKFEGIYPPDAPPVGFLRSEPVYARDCVHQLHSRETWLKEARVVKIGEEAYKTVKARPRWDKINQKIKTDLPPLEVFGLWQTEPYEPPTAVDGKVPRNEYGNVELFKPCMLPKGCVHLQLPGLNRIAKKLGIDCSPAVVGFDGHKGSIHPVMLSHGTLGCEEKKFRWKEFFLSKTRFDGFVVCKEYKDTLLAAWDEEQENARKREEEKRDKRIYGNWKKLIKGLLIRERIKLKYNTE